MSTATTTSLPAKFAALETVLGQELVERETEIECSILTILSCSTLFMLGPPGVAKSLLFDRLQAYIGGVEFFKILMAKTTEPAEVFGPPSLVALDQGRFEREIEGYLPTAHGAMFDEVWRANSAILNGLLWAINERQYRHGRHVVSIPLRFMICAANDLPMDNDLNALYDRMVFRLLTDHVQDVSSFERMLTTQRPENPTPILSWDEVTQAQAEVSAVVIPPSVIEAIVSIRAKLAEKEIRPSERRYFKLLDVVRAAAWLDGSTVADTDHLMHAEHILWEEQEQRGEVARVVQELSNPLDTEIDVLMRNIRLLEGEVDKVDTDEARMRLGNDMHAKIMKASQEINDLKARAGTGRRARKVARVRSTLTKLNDRALAEIYQLTPEEAAALKAQRGLA